MLNTCHANPAKCGTAGVVLCILCAGCSRFKDHVTAGYTGTLLVITGHMYYYVRGLGWTVKEPGVEAYCRRGKVLLYHRKPEVGENWFIHGETETVDWQKAIDHVKTCSFNPSQAYPKYDGNYENHRYVTVVHV